MNNFIEWNTLDFKKQSGKEKLRCPSCDGSRSDKKDKSLAIDHKDGYGKCFYCEALTFRESNTKTDYEIPVQTWKNFTKLSDKMVKWVRDTRSISQTTLNTLGITEEKYYQLETSFYRLPIVLNNPQLNHRLRPCV